LVSAATFYDQTGDFNTSFDANRIHVEPATRLVFVLDHEDGVISVSLDKVLEGGLIKAHEFRVLMGGCENMAVSSFSVYLTCPELVKLNRQNGAAEQTARNNFYAYEMRLLG
jgi:hypothetical protein